MDGVVLSRMRLDDWRAQYLTESDFPFVAFGRTHPPMNFPHIGVDGQSGVRALAAHLIVLGHRRIAYVSAPPDLTLQADRFAGYREGLAAAGVPFDESLITEGDLTRKGGYQAAQRLFVLPDRPTAIIGANDLTAIGIMSAAREHGLVVGRDLAVAGFDGIEDAEHTQPPLTTLNQPVYEIARRLVRMLLARIDGDALEERQILLQPELIIRASTAG